MPATHDPDPYEEAQARVDKVKELFNQHSGKEGQLSKREFCKVMEGLGTPMDLEDVKKLWKSIDVNDKQFVDLDELMKWIFPPASRLATI